MKLRILIPFFIIGFLAGCQKDDPTFFGAALEGTWSLINISGGFVGTNCDIPEGIVVWTFSDSQVEMENNDPSGEAPCSGVLTGAFSYSILEQNSKHFLLIDGNERGRINLEGNELTINQNEFSTGSGADGFVLILKKF